MRNEVILSGRYAWVFMDSGESVCDMVVFSNSALDHTGKGYEKVLPSPELLAVWCLLHEGKQGFVICQDYKLVSSQLSFKKV